MTDKKIKYSSGTMTYDFWKTYIKPHMNKKSIQYLAKNQSDKSECLEYLVLNLPNGKINSYDDIYFLDIGLPNGTYHCIYIQDIDTSSAYAFSACYMDNENEVVETTIDDLIDMVGRYNNKETIREILEKSYDVDNMNE